MEYNYRLFLEELSKRNIALEPIGNSEYFKASFKGHVEYISEISNRLVPSHLFFILNNKFISKQLVSLEGYSTPRGQVFLPSQYKEALEFAKSIGFPVVAKGTTFSKGNYVYPNILSENEFNTIWHTCLLKPHPYSEFPPEEILIEESFTDWVDYRFMMIKGKNPVVLKRLPPKVVGNGYNTLNELLKKENYHRANPRRTCTGEIYLDDSDGLRRLRHNQLDFDSILKKNKHVFLRYNANESYGGSCEVIEDEIHESYKSIGESIFNLFDSLDYLAVDLMIKSPLEPATPYNYVFIEFATYPGYSMFLKPTIGKPINILSPIIDLLFPETRCSDI